MTTLIVRNDRKPARKPRLGVPTSNPQPTKRGPVDEGSPSWHELVQPGEKGDPKKAQARAAAVRHGVIIKQEGTGVPRSSRRAVGNRPTEPGRLVLHRTRAKLTDGGPRLDVQIRRLTRVGINARTQDGYTALTSLMRHDQRPGGINREATRQARHDARVAAGLHSTRATRRNATVTR